MNASWMRIIQTSNNDKNAKWQVWWNWLQIFDNSSSQISAKTPKAKTDPRKIFTRLPVSFKNLLLNQISIIFKYSENQVTKSD